MVLLVIPFLKTARFVIRIILENIVLTPFQYRIKYNAREIDGLNVLFVCFSVTTTLFFQLQQTWQTYLQ